MTVHTRNFQVGTVTVFRLDSRNRTRLSRAFLRVTFLWSLGICRSDRPLYSDECPHIHKLCWIYIYYSVFAVSSLFYHLSQPPPSPSMRIDNVSVALDFTSSSSLCHSFFFYFIRSLLLFSQYKLIFQSVQYSSYFIINEGWLYGLHDTESVNTKFITNK